MHRALLQILLCHDRSGLEDRRLCTTSIELQHNP
jgi:hypothetical protein